MARLARVVIPGTPHHVTQRGNRRQKTFFCEADYAMYLRLAAEAFHEAKVDVWAYCLMPNHVHLIAVPSTPEALAEAVSATHLRYTRRVNEREGWKGYLWQGRFASFPMDDQYLLKCARYVGLNPVRAHLDDRRDPLLTSAPLVKLLGAELPTFFDIDVAEETQRRLRSASTTGRPLGAAPWIQALEQTTGRVLTAPAMGRPRK
ncbi:MAG TPA: transposase, partial [Caulobacteraceae bacterium]|nr:transposase [Caulobacteraceae bacterium]